MPQVLIRIDVAGEWPVCVDDDEALPAGDVRWRYVCDVGTRAIVPDADGSRAFLIPPRSESALAAGFWELTFTFAGDVNAPDLDRWTVGGRALAETALLPLLIEAEPAFV